MAWIPRRRPGSACPGPPISTNWAAHPPEQLWKIPVGPAWSSFAVAGQLLFTQEQRGPMETVVCYDAETGREVWKREMRLAWMIRSAGPVLARRLPSPTADYLSRARPGCSCG